MNTDITKSKNNLPATMEDLTKFILIGREKLVAVRAEIRAIDKIGLAQEVHNQKLDEAQDLASALLDAEVKMGELLEGLADPTASRAGMRQLPDGITHKQSHYFQAMAAHPGIVEQVKAEAVENEDLPTRASVLQRIKEQKENVHFMSSTDECNTPKSMFDRVINLFGEIDLDPCSNEGQPNVPANLHYNKSENGLSHDWVGRIFMNPPYGNELPQWIDKIISENEKGNITEAIILVPSRTDTIWFRKLRNFPRCFIWGRLKFGSENSAPFPSMAVYIGSNLDGFKKVFNDIGDVYVWQQ